MRPALKIEGVSKQYRLGRVGASSLRDDVQRIWAGIQLSPSPFLSRDEANDRTKKSEDAYVWALKDINFTVNPGDV
jgi:lipopolysaccharide transport system ATP-binding protein